MLLLLTMGYIPSPLCSRWYSYTNYGNDRTDRFFPLRMHIPMVAARAARILLFTLACSSASAAFDQRTGDTRVHARRFIINPPALVYVYVVLRTCG